METVAFIEEIGRNGDVVRRHLIERLPARIGRGYDSDVIIDDPHVEASHLEVRLAADGTMEVVDLGSLNGTHRLGDTARISTRRIHGDEVFRIGQTQLRIRLPVQHVPAALPLPQRTWDRHLWVFVGSVGLLICFTAWSQYVKTFNTDTSDIYSFPLSASLFLFFWAAIWSLVCRTLHGMGNFVTHGIIAFLGFSVLSFVETLTGYINFAFDLRGLDLVWSACAATVLVAMLYRHLRLTVRLSPRILTALSVFLVAILYGGIFGLPAIRNADKPGLQSYDTTIKPSVFLINQGISPDQFFNIANQLKAKTDKDAGSMTH